jgi:hypothetical protein
VAKRFASWRFVSLLGFAAACITTPQAIPLQMSAEYGCPADSVKVTNISDYNYRGEGCGHSDTFVCTMPNKLYVGPNSQQQCFKVSQLDAGAT